MPSFEETVEAAIAPGPHRVLSGAVFLAGNKSGIQYAKAFGTTSIESDAPALQPDAMMVMASCTKLPTSIAALQCVERGLIDLDEDAARLIPEVAGFGIFGGFDDNEKPIVKPAKEKITLRKLLTHTSGFAYPFIDSGLYNAQQALGVKALSAVAPFHEKCAGPLLFEPGQGWAYGMSTDWVGKMVERANGGVRLSEYCEQNIFRPLDIRDMVWRYDDHPDMPARLMSLTERKEDGLVNAGPEKRNLQEEFGGSSLYAAPSEYFKLLQAVLREDSCLLTKESFAKMFHIEVENPQVPVSISLMWTNYEKTAPVPSSELVWGHSLAGAVMMTDVKGWLRKGTMLWSGMRNLYWFIDRESELITFMATQFSPYEDPGVVKVKTAFHEEMLKRFGKS